MRARGQGHGIGSALVVLVLLGLVKMAAAQGAAVPAEPVPGASASGAPGAAPAGGHPSPVESAQQALDQLRSGGKDVTALQAELDAIKPSWDEIQGFQKELASLAGEAQRAAKQQEIAKLAGTLQPRVHQLVQKIQTMAKDLEATGATGVGADPGKR